MVYHESIHIDSNSVALSTISKFREKKETVLVIQKDGPAVIPPDRDMINRTRILKS